MTDHSMPALPEPDVVSLPEDADTFTNEVGNIWAFVAHGYDTGMNPYFSADTLHAYAQPLLERIKELEADAARYRFLRDEEMPQRDHYVTDGEHGPIEGRRLDKAIDAERSSKGGA